MGFPTTSLVVKSNVVNYTQDVGLVSGELVVLLCWEEEAGVPSSLCQPALVPKGTDPIVGIYCAWRVRSRPFSHGLLKVGATSAQPTSPIHHARCTPEIQLWVPLVTLHPNKWTRSMWPTCYLPPQDGKKLWLLPILCDNSRATRGKGIGCRQLS